MTTNKTHGLGTRAIHAGQAPDKETGAIMTPIYLTSTFVQESPGKHTGYEYSRTGNPTRTALEACVASLEGAAYGIAYASGSAATADVMHMLSSGDKVICSDDVYGGTYRQFDKVFSRLGLTYEFLDLTKEENLTESAFQGSKLVWLETPSNPLLKVIDIRKVAALAKKIGALLVVDNTFMTPYNQQPLSLGADLVVHSTTKYINGHSDVVGGIAVTNDKNLADKMHFLQNAIGAVPSPSDCFMVLRGLKTLHLRMAKHNENAQKIADYLVAHEAVEKVIYPGLSSHPQHSTAKEQARGFGGMVTFIVKGGLEKATSVLEKFQLFALAESLGGVESLVEHPAIMTHAAVEPNIRAELGIDDGLIRLSVGVEDIEDLIKDLSQALS